MLHKEIPFIRIVIPLCAGIISGLFFRTGSGITILVAIIIILLFTLAYFQNNRGENVFFGIAMNLSLILGGYLLYTFEKQSITRLDNTLSVIYCTLEDYPDERPNSYRLKVRLQSLLRKDSLSGLNGSMLLYMRKDLSPVRFMPGDILKIRCIPEEIKNRGNPYEFNYSFYLENQAIKYMAFINNNSILQCISPDKRNIRHRALIIREKIIDMYRNRGITGRNLALIAAMTLGEKSLLEPDQKDSFIKAGVMHIMAVSGLHAVILSIFVFNLLFFMKGKLNILRVTTALLVLWAFAFITGLTPSVLRATLMFSFIQAGMLMKRPANSLNSVLASAFVLILIKPSVIFETGFLLSYSAVIFIIVFYRDLYLKFHFKNFFADKIWQSVVVTLTAQAGTLPLTIMLFNRFPAYFLLSNVIIVPMASLLIISGCLIPMTYPVVFLSASAGKLLNFMTGLTDYLTTKVAEIPGSSIEGIGMTLPECMLLILIMTFLFKSLVKREPNATVILLSAFLVLSITNTFNTISIKRSNELIVYNVPGLTAVGIRTGKILNLYSQDGQIPQEVIRHCAIMDLQLNRKDLDIPVCVETGAKRILIAGSVSSKQLTDIAPDILIMTGAKPSIKNVSGLTRIPDILVLSSEVVINSVVPENFTGHLRHPVHLTKKTGAFTMNL